MDFTELFSKKYKYQSIKHSHQNPSNVPILFHVTVCSRIGMELLVGFMVLQTRILWWTFMTVYIFFFIVSYAFVYVWMMMMFTSCLHNIPYMYWFQLGNTILCWSWRTWRCYWEKGSGIILSALTADWTPLTNICYRTITELLENVVARLVPLIYYLIKGDKNNIFIIWLDLIEHH